MSIGLLWFSGYYKFHVLNCIFATYLLKLECHIFVYLIGSCPIAAQVIVYIMFWRQLNQAWLNQKTGH